MNKSHYSLVLFLGIFIACNSKSTQKEGNVSPAKADEQQIDTAALKPATAQEILARKEVPVLCYHQIRNWSVSYTHLDVYKRQVQIVLLMKQKLKLTLLHKLI